MAEQPIIIKKHKKAHDQTHGGAWKIAYADFVTAMMAFFLLMWLVNVATEETKKGIAEYFTSSVISMESAGAGTGMIEGEVSAAKSSSSELEVENESNNKSNAYNANIQKIKEQEASSMQLHPDEFAPSKMGDKDADRKITTYTNESNKPSVEHRIKREGIILEDKNVADLKKINDKEYSKGVKELRNVEEDDEKDKEKQIGDISLKNSKIITKQLEQKQPLDNEKNSEDAESEKSATQILQQKEILKKIENNIKEAFNSIQEIEKFKHNLIIELTDEGIHIQIIDSSDHEMFKSGSPTPVKFTENIIKTLGHVLEKIPNRINITGHTDSKPYNKKGYGNWELSSDRAHATRRILENSHITSDRFIEVNGRADRDPFNKNDPTLPENRRISITVLFDELQKQQQ